MRLTPLTPACGAANCPQLYLTDTGSVVVQGDLLAPEAVDVPAGAGEAFVAVPPELILLAAKALAVSGPET